MNVPITKTQLTEADHQAVLDCLRSGWLVQGPQVAGFESLFCEYTGSALALATTSCTTALHLALLAAGVGPGDEVIVPAFTWVASANTVEQLGARPVFIDIDLMTYNLNPDQLESCHSQRTRAVMPVSLFGLSADLHPILEWAGRYQLPVIEDAACALGTFYHGRHAGTLADYSCFSFHPRKTVTTGEGGMIATRHLESQSLLRSLRDHGASQSDLSRHLGARPYVLPDFHQAGFNYRMTDFQAALGLSQLKRVEQLLQSREAWAQVYLKELQEFSAWLRPPHTPPNLRHSYQSLVCLYAPEEPTLENVDRLHAQRNQLMDYLQQLGVSTRPGTHCLHTLHYYAGKYQLRPEDCPNAYLSDRLSLSLPLYGSMTDQELEKVVGGLRSWRRSHA